MLVHKATRDATGWCLFMPRCSGISTIGIDPHHHHHHDHHQALRIMSLSGGWSLSVASTGWLTYRYNGYHGSLSLAAPHFPPRVPMLCSRSPVRTHDYALICENAGYQAAGVLVVGCGYGVPFGARWSGAAPGAPPPGQRQAGRQGAVSCGVAGQSMVWPCCGMSRCGMHACMIGGFVVQFRFRFFSFPTQCFSRLIRPYGRCYGSRADRLVYGWGRL